MHGGQYGVFSPHPEYGKSPVGSETSLLDILWLSRMRMSWEMLLQLQKDRLW